MPELNFKSELATIVATTLEHDPNSDLSTVPDTFGDKQAYKRAYQADPSLMQRVVLQYQMSIGAISKEEKVARLNDLTTKEEHTPLTESEVSEQARLYYDVNNLPYQP